MRLLVLHGHFYQPPRENAWTGVIDNQPSAAPFSDWNERVHAECYRPNSAARVLEGGSGRILRLVNNYRWINFNFGPTLLNWMERYHPVTYRRILEADRQSREARGGHGNAIAQAYHHAILPLCSDRDRVTEVHWGVADFRRRFGREPEALWLPETACNDAVLGTLVDKGLKYVILAPSQAARVRPLGGGEWIDVSDGSVDPSRAYRWFHRDGSGRSIAVFFYDGLVSQAVAFENVLASSQYFLDRLAAAARSDDALVHVAADGETYGHHVKFGDRTLAHALSEEAARRGFEVTNYGAVLEAAPPEWEVEISHGPEGEGTSWSCAHGVGRWVRDCGCHTGGREGWNQAWRGPLRRAYDLLRDHVAELFEAERGKLFRDPWAARDAYVEVVLEPDGDRGPFLERHAPALLSEEDRVRALTHLEIQRYALRMYTSCGWFFNDVSGIETLQTLQYAARVFDLLEEIGLPAPKEAFLAELARAKSNLPEHGTGADVYRKFVEPSRVTPRGLAAHLAMVLAVDGLSEEGKEAEHRYRLEDLRRHTHGRLTLVTGAAELQSVWTGRRTRHAFAALHMGGPELYAAVRDDPGAEERRRITEPLWRNFASLSLPRLLKQLQETYGPEEFGVEHILPQSRRRIFENVFGELLSRFSESYARLYEENRRNLEMLQGAGFQVPKELRAAAEFTLGRRFEDEVRRQEGSEDPESYREAVAIAEEVSRRGYQIDRTFAERAFEGMIRAAVEAALRDPVETSVRHALELLKIAQKLGLSPNLFGSQNALWAAAEERGLPALFRPLVEALGFKVETFPNLGS